MAGKQDEHTLQDNDISARVRKLEKDFKKRGYLNQSRTKLEKNATIAFWLTVGFCIFGLLSLIVAIYKYFELKKNNDNLEIFAMSLFVFAALVSVTTAAFSYKINLRYLYLTEKAYKQETISRLFDKTLKNIDKNSLDSKEPAALKLLEALAIALSN